MSDLDETVARFLHLRTATLARGDPIGPPLVPTSAYLLPGEPQGRHQYGRWTNPVWDVVEAALGALEAAEVVAFPSGMAAVAAVLAPHLRPGDRVLLPPDGYYTTRSFARTCLEPMGVVVEDCPTRDYAAKDLAAYRLVYLETPSNPGLEVCDIAAIAKRAHVCGALVVADNTTLTPLGQRPLDLGADIVVSSDTKTINGHSDAMFGHVGTRDSDIAAKIREWRTLTGAIPGQLEAWLVQRGLETLEVRFDRMCASAGVIAERLSAHPAVTAVRYPGLTGDPGHSIAKAQMIRFGSLIGLTLASGDAAERFINTARFIIPATSFGGVLTSGERRARWGDQVDPGFVRLSIGCEPVEALWADMASALGGL